MKTLRMLFAALALALTPAIALTACESAPKITAPFSSEYSFEQNAYSALKTYEVVATEVASLVEDPATPPTVKSILATASLNVEPLAVSANAALAAYSEVQGRIKARQDAGEDVTESLLNEAGAAYAKAKAVWEQAKSAVESFPGIVQAVKAAD
jgi:hypothetical protein